MKKYLGPLKGYYLFVQISSILLCSVFGSLGAGIWLDHKLGTTPWLLFVLMIVGLTVGMYIIYRTVKGLK
jgi:F0F1-type ATP synthase assembly protein I